MKHASRRIAAHVSHAVHSLTESLRKAGSRQILRAGPGRGSALALAAALVVVVVSLYSISSATQINVDLNVARLGHTATRLADGRVLITGGQNETGMVSGSEMFDSALNAFSIAPE